MRGFKRCAAPGCATRYGQGKLFKQFPWNKPELTEKWFTKLPLGFKPLSSTALCEDHFEKSQFEKPRQDGKRKFKAEAIPTSFRSCTPKTQRKPLGDITFSTSPNSSSPKTFIRNDCLLKPARPISLHFSTIDDSLFDSCGLLGKDNAEARTSSQVISEVPVQSKENIPVSNMSDSTVQYEGVHHEGRCLLDEATGLFIPDLNSKKDEGVHLQTLDINFDDIIAEEKKQEAEIASLMAVIDKQNARIAELSEVHEKHSKLILKYDSLRKSESTVKERLKRGMFSPWLSEMQLKRLQRKSSRGMKFTTKEIQEGLILKMKCGSSGYGAFVKRYPLLPSSRVLTESVQFIKFDSGVLHEMFDLLQNLVRGMSDIEKDCQIVLDEMSIEPGMRYDNSLKKFVGMSTLPSHTGVAEKALVVLLAGICRRWKIAVAVYFTSKKSEESKKKQDISTADAYRNIIDSITIRSENIGLKISGVTTDMGPDNLGFWKSYGITGGRKEVIKSSFPNPVRKDAEVHILPDSVHLMKAIKSSLETNEIFHLPPDVVESQGLPSAQVDYKHIEALMEYENGHELKVAFRLKEQNVHCPKHFKKMNVGTTAAVINHRTGVGLKKMGMEKGDSSYQTTAWFIILLNTFFELVTCRHKGLAISKKNPEVFEKAMGVIKLIAHIFQHMKVGKDGTYKPIQRGMRILCASLINLTEYFLEKRGYNYLMLGRFTSDCIENLFSCIRLTQPIPHAVAFLQCLKVVTLAQFSEAVRGSNYAYEESFTISDSNDFLEEARRRANERAMAKHSDSLEELCDNPIRLLTEQDFKMLNSRV